MIRVDRGFDHGFQVLGFGTWRGGVPDGEVGQAEDEGGRCAELGGNGERGAGGLELDEGFDEVRAHVADSPAYLTISKTYSRSKISYDISSILLGGKSLTVSPRLRMSNNITLAHQIH